ncbi:MFS general substrate transporter [Ophiobolus disseminans]|uniref:MFS general substrate transporter n=1 Tax=Ophiobolus disseminans TaxID=1469910 RepID=A0A6A7A485_9PLEO|nr:MFS general substrate transporter [Ophiobolus disseminans]
MSIPLSDLLSYSTDTASEPVQIVLNEHTSRSATAYAWSTRRKWTLLAIVAFCQVSMNFYAAVYSNAVDGINTSFGVSNARMGMVAFLISYAAPWSEELGRWPIMQASLLLTNTSILVCARATSFGGVIGGRVMGGISSAGGSVTLGIVADMFIADNQQHAVAFASLFSSLGAVIGGIAGGPIQQFLPSWRWNPWIQLMLGSFTQLLHLIVAKETLSTILLGREAKKQRKLGGQNRFNPKAIAMTMFRPYQMLMFEPVVLFLSRLSGFADALIFSFFESYARRAKGETLTSEARLKALLYHAVLLPIGLLICAFVATSPPLHRSGPRILDYMVAAYGSYAASATGGNGFMRDFLAGMCALFTGPMYKKLSIRNSYLVLFGLATLFCIPVYIFYYKGAAIRARSKFASKLAKDREELEALKRLNSVDVEEMEAVERRVSREV